MAIRLIAEWNNGAECWKKRISDQPSLEGTYQTSIKII